MATTHLLNPNAGRYTISDRFAERLSRSRSIASATSERTNLRWRPSLMLGSTPRRAYSLTVEGGDVQQLGNLVGCEQLVKPAHGPPLMLAVCARAEDLHIAAPSSPAPGSDSPQAKDRVRRGLGNGGMTPNRSRVRKPDTCERACLRTCTRYRPSTTSNRVQSTRGRDAMAEHLVGKAPVTAAPMAPTAIRQMRLGRTPARRPAVQHVDRPAGLSGIRVEQLAFATCLRRATDECRRQCAATSDK
jgi:hypothetical protein